MFLSIYVGAFFWSLFASLHLVNGSKALDKYDITRNNLCLFALPFGTAGIIQHLV